MHQPTRKHPFSTICKIFLKQTRRERVQVARLTIGRLMICGLTLVGVTTALLPDRVLSVEPTPVPTAPSPAIKPEMPAAPLSATKKLLGQWLTKEPLDGDMVMLVFTPDGNVFILSGMSASGNAIARQFQYRVDEKPQPMHLDVILTADATVKSLFEFTPNGELRLQVLGTRPSKPRPAALTETATLFQKLSDDTTLPLGVELKKPSAK